MAMHVCLLEEHFQCLWVEDPACMRIMYGSTAILVSAGEWEGGNPCGVIWERDIINCDGLW